MYCARCGVEGKDRLLFFAPNGWKKWTRGGVHFYLCEKCDQIYWRELTLGLNKVTSTLD